MSRIDCYPEAIGGLEVVNPESCRRRGCLYEAATPPIPSCFYKPLREFGYRVTGNREETDLGFRVNLTWNGAPTPYDTPLSLITFEVQRRDRNVLRFKVEFSFCVSLSISFP